MARRRCSEPVRRKLLLGGRAEQVEEEEEEVKDWILRETC